MSATRREVLFLLSGFVSSAVKSEALPSQDNIPPSYYIPVQRTANQEFKRRRNPTCSERQTGHSRAVGSPRNHITAGRDAACSTSPRAQRNAADSEGTVQLTINGTSHVIGPGSGGSVYFNDEHGIKNVGTTPATYFVVAVGPGADAQ